MKRVDISSWKKRSVAAISVVWPITVWLCQPLFPLILPWLSIATIVLYLVILVLLRSRFLTAALTGVLIGLVYEPGPRGGTIEGQINEDIQRLIGWTIASIVVGLSLNPILGASDGALPACVQ